MYWRLIPWGPLLAASMDGLMRTADSVTPSLSGGDVIVSLLGYAAVYLIIYPFGLWFMLRAVKR